MRSIAFHIQKGGVGKTTLSGNVAALASEPHRIVLVDCDPQGTPPVGSSPSRRLNDEPFIFEELVQKLSSLGFDLAIFDLSPGMSRLEKSVLLAMDDIVVLFTPEYFSVDDIIIFNNELRKLNKNFRRSVRFDRIVCNAINHSFRRHREFAAALEDLDYELYLVPQDARLAESQIRHKSASAYDHRAKAVPELRRLADSLVSG